MRVFEGMIGVHVEVYIDDIITKTPTTEDHVANLKSIFQRLKWHNMRLNPSNAPSVCQQESF